MDDPTATAPTVSPEASGGLSGGQIAGIVIGVLLFVALIIGGVVAFLKIKDRRKNQGEYHPQFEEFHHAKDLPYIQPPAIEGLI
uniref:Syndecan n=1 Tax=Ascaris lumbricoides TaxID=6252 RepID=A0A0M3HUI3_ASCLU